MADKVYKVKPQGIAGCTNSAGKLVRVIDVIFSPYETSIWLLVKLPDGRPAFALHDELKEV